MTEKKSITIKLLLIGFGALVGFILATGGQWFWSWHANSKEQHKAALVLLHTLQHELQQVEYVRRSLTNWVANPMPSGNMIDPEAFDIFHQATLYEEMHPTFTVLNSMVLQGLLDFDQKLTQVRFARDKNRHALEITNGDLWSTNTVVWPVYVEAMKRLEASGASLQKTLFEQYPRIKKSQQEN